MQDFSVDTANLLGFGAAMALWICSYWPSRALIQGVFLVMFTKTIPPLWTRRHRGWVILSFTISLLVTSTINAVLTTVLCVMWFKQYSYTGSYENAYIAIEAVAYTTTILVNVGCTSLIVWRIWWVGRLAPNSRTRSKYKAIAVTIIESGMLYTVTLLAWSAFAITPQFVGISSLIMYIFTMVVSIAPLLIVALLLNDNISDNLPVTALGEGFGTAIDTRASPTPNLHTPRHSRDNISTTIRFAAFGSSSQHTGPNLAVTSNYPKMDRSLDEKNLEEDSRVLQNRQSSDAVQSPTSIVRSAPERRDRRIVDEDT
ncbi:hypothetical protein FRB98_001242 [Tulasnella sp. 332]|nr:hypothetical protein FRB98_001242 [Tulasnella sp. 332]